MAQNHNFGAQIMGFSSKRGRPKSASPETDTGTAELRAKRALSETFEPLDLLWQRGHFTDEEHGAGLYLRWLYTLKWGAAAPRSAHSTIEDFPARLDDPTWRAEREKEYQEIVRALLHHSCKKVTMDLCVFHQLKNLRVIPNIKIGLQTIAKYRALYR